MILNDSHPQFEWFVNAVQRNNYEFMRDGSSFCGLGSVLIWQLHIEGLDIRGTMNWLHQNDVHCDNDLIDRFKSKVKR